MPLRCGRMPLAVRNELVVALPLSLRTSFAMGLLMVPAVGGPEGLGRFRLSASAFPAALRVGNL